MHGERRGAGDRVADVGAAQTADLRRVHELGAAGHRRERQAAGDRLGDRRRGRARGRSARIANIRPVRPKPVWISSATRRMPCCRQSVDQHLHVGARRDDEAALAEHQLDHHAGDLLGGDVGGEELLELAPAGGCVGAEAVGRR